MASTPVIYPLGQLTDTPIWTIKQFTNLYQTYAHRLQEGKPLRLPAVGWSHQENAVQQLLIEKRWLVRPIRPIIQLETHLLHFDPQAGRFFEKGFGATGLSWGVCLSFPQTYQDPETLETMKSTHTPNGKLFRQIQQWARHKTSPTSFLFKENRCTLATRTGLLAHTWAMSLPQLAVQNLGLIK